ncbi:MAG: hypothetical protein IJT70_06415 [Clostridia bacterium]|nr:hypothetical protein [Clostridia bacterium]
MRRIFERVISMILVILTAACSSPCLFCPVRAEENGGYRLFTEKDPSVIDLDGKDQIESYDDRSFTSSSEKFEIDYGTYKGRAALIAESKGGETDADINTWYPDGLDLTKYNELYFQMRAEGETGTVTLYVTLITDDDSYTVKGDMELGSSYDVYVPIYGLSSRSSVKAIYFTFNSSAAINTVYLSRIYGDSLFTCTHIGRFSSDSFSSDNVFELYADRISANLHDGAFSIKAETKKSETELPTSSARVGASGADSGTLTLYVGNGEEEREISTVNLFPGMNYYTFVYPSVEGASSYRLSFSAVSETAGDKLTVNSVSFGSYCDALRTSAEAAPANITSCTLSQDGKSASVSGTISGSYVVNNLNTKIALFARDMWGGEPALVCTSDISTLFDMRFSSSALPDPLYTYSYFIAPEPEEGSAADPISSTAYLASSSAAPSSAGVVFGIESSDSALPFDTLSDAVLVEADLEKLKGDETGGKFHSFSGGYYYFDSSYVSELDSSVGFYLSTGLSVYLRIVTPSPGGAKYKISDTEDPAETKEFCAVIDFLTKRYSGVSGLVLGKRIDSFVYNEYGEKDLFAYAGNYVRSLRLASSVAKINSPGISVLVPLGDGYVYPDADSAGREAYDRISGVGKYSCDPMMLAEFISRIVSSGGAFPWQIMYECEDAPYDAAERVSRASNRLTQIGSSFAGYVLYWMRDGELTQDDVESFYGEFTASAETLGTKAVIVSLAGFGGFASDGVVSSLKSSAPVKVISGKADCFYETETDEVTLIKDLRRSYGTEGFSVGGSFMALTTEADPLLSSFDGIQGGRALHASADPSKGNRGVLFCSFGSPVDLSDTEYLEITLSVGAEDGESRALTVALGGKTSRLEFSAEPDAGKAATVRCYLGDDAPTDAEYVALELETDGGASLNVSKIALSGIADIPSERSKNDLPNGEGKIGKNEVIIVIIVFAVLSIGAFAFISAKGERREKKDGKDAKNGGK